MSRVDAKGSARNIRQAVESAAMQVVARLTDREMDVLRLIGYGLERVEIANELGISSLTVKHYMYRIRMKLNCRSRGDEVRIALRSGLASLWQELPGPQREGILIGE